MYHSTLFAIIWTDKYLHFIYSIELQSFIVIISCNIFQVINFIFIKNSSMSNCQADFYVLYLH